MPKTIEGREILIFDPGCQNKRVVYLQSSVLMIESFCGYYGFTAAPIAGARRDVDLKRSLPASLF